MSCCCRYYGYGIFFALFLVGNLEFGLGIVFACLHVVLCVVTRLRKNYFIENLGCVS